MDAYIEFRNVVKKFDDFVALDHVSLQIPKGAFVTLLGPSGCGKTTLMRQLAGFSEPEEGDVLVNGKRMNGCLPLSAITPFGFQEYALFPHMTVYENISYGLKLKKMPKEEKDRKVEEMLEMFNLQGLDGRFPQAALRRPAAAGGLCPCSGDGTRDPAVGRTPQQSGRQAAGGGADGAAADPAEVWYYHHVRYA